MRVHVEWGVNNGFTIEGDVETKEAALEALSKMTYRLKNKGYNRDLDDIL